MKNNIKHEEEIYDNSSASKILYRARTNTLNLNWRKKFQGENTHCPLCNYEYEDLQHFLINCENLEETRSKCNYWKGQDYQTFIKHILLFQYRDKEEIEAHRDILEQMWKIRCEKL